MARHWFGKEKPNRTGVHQRRGFPQRHDSLITTMVRKNLVNKFNHLLKEDIIGYLTVVRDVETVTCGLRKRDLEIISESNVTCKVTLWGALGEKFVDSHIAKTYSGATLIIIVTSTRVKKFQGCQGCRKVIPIDGVYTCASCNVEYKNALTLYILQLSVRDDTDVTYVLLHKLAERMIDYSPLNYIVMSISRMNVDAPQNIENISMAESSQNTLNPEENIATPRNFGKPNHTCGHCGAIMWYEERSRKDRSTSNPKFTSCCLEGRVKLPLLSLTPQTLHYLLSLESRVKGVNFRKEIRTYSSMFALTSLRYRVDSKINRGKGPYIYRVCSQNCHMIGYLLPKIEKRPQVAQLYIYNTENETNNRVDAMRRQFGIDDIDVEVTKDLSTMLDEHTRGKRQISVLAEYCFSIADHKNCTTDGRQYTLPSANEVAGLIVGDLSKKNFELDVIVEHHDPNWVDIISRVFEIKLKQLMADLNTGKPFGKVIASLSEDIATQQRKRYRAHNMQVTNDQVESQTLFEIEAIMLRMGKSFKDRWHATTKYRAFMRFSCSWWRLLANLADHTKGKSSGHCECYTQFILSVAFVQSIRVQYALEMQHFVTNRYNKIIKAFDSWMLQIGSGSIYDDVTNELLQLPHDIFQETIGNPIEAIIEMIYPSLMENCSNPSYITERAILTPKNDMVQDSNEFIIDMLLGEGKTYLSSNKICKGSVQTNDEDLLYPTEFLKSLRFNGIPNHEIQLKVGAPIMLLRNINQIEELCNGTRLIVTVLGTWSVHGDIISGTNKGKRVTIPRIIMSLNESNGHSSLTDVKYRWSHALL
ncbi:hypothetical protein OSB04_020111 [Centaurea solstitialis]|uniref:DNA helicase Pif1-like 2B domain-containing protein n=1 Tax=Centaurea solstitialis TaxID=347529 RepID=A0AA38TB48_9ASTR|nr:hypothetical protein OSB04_020111 [Centaurea solstitialis]